MEEWKKHPRTNTYEISNTGKIRNRRTGRMMKTYKNTQGYESIQLRYDGSAHTERVHRLVAEVYHTDSKYYGLDVNHVDGDKFNNSVDNLEWCDRQYNVQHAFEHGLKNSDHRKQKIQIVETGEIFESMTLCADHLGVDKSSVVSCCRGASKTCKGYHIIKI